MPDFTDALFRYWEMAQFTRKVENSTIVVSLPYGREKRYRTEVAQPI
jgi:hypothetical protein